MELTQRKLEILRRVVEEYFATGQPVGSRSLVERPGGLEVSSSTVRSELYELEAVGLLTHPHTSAGRVPTPSGYRVYTYCLVGAIDGRPAPFPLDLTAMRNEVEEALQRTTEALSETTHLLALVTAPALEAAAVRHVEVLRLQSHVVIVVVITASGAVSKRVFELEDGVDAGLVDWARAYLAETIVGKRASASVVRRAFEEPELSVRERRFLETLRPAFADVVASATDLYVGGAAGLLGEASGGARGVPAAARGARAAGGRPRVAARRARPEATRRARRARARGRGVTGDVIRRRDVRAPESFARRGRPARPAADGLREGDPLGPRRRIRALPSRRRRVRGTLMATTEQDYYELLGVARDASHAEIKRAFRQLARELHPDVSEEPDAEVRFRSVAEAYEVLSDPERRRTYDRFGHAGLRGGGFRPMDADFGSLSDVFAAFFGETIFGQARSAGPRPARGPDVAAQVEIELVDALRGISLEVAVRVARSCEACSGSGAAPGTSPITCPGCNGAGVVQQVSRTVLGQIVRSGTCPRCDGAGRIVETPCERCDGDGRTLEDVPLELDVPAGIHDGQRIRVRGAGHAGALGGPPGDVYVTVAVRPLEGVERDGDDLRVGASVTMTEAALGTTVTVPTPDGALEIELAPGTQPGATHVVRGRGMPSLETGRRGDLRVAVDVRVPTRLTAEQRAEVMRLESELGAEAYRDDDGFLGRLKSAFR